MEQYDKDLRKAMKIARKERAEASAQKHAAFANAVASAVHGMSGGYGGPSVREHAAGYLTTGKKFSFQEAVKLLLDLQGPIFGPISDLHRQCYRDEHCFDDDPQDIQVLEGTHPN